MSEELVKKWGMLLNHPTTPPIKKELHDMWADMFEKTYHLNFKEEDGVFGENSMIIPILRVLAPYLLFFDFLDYEFSEDENPEQRSVDTRMNFTHELLFNGLDFNYDLIKICTYELQLSFDFDFIKQIKEVVNPTIIKDASKQFDELIEEKPNFIIVGLNDFPNFLIEHGMMDGETEAMLSRICHLDGISIYYEFLGSDEPEYIISGNDKIATYAPHEFILKFEKSLDSEFQPYLKAILNTQLKDIKTDSIKYFTWSK